MYTVARLYFFLQNNLKKRTKEPVLPDLLFLIIKKEIIHNPDHAYSTIDQNPQRHERHLVTQLCLLQMTRIYHVRCAPARIRTYNERKGRIKMRRREGKKRFRLFVDVHVQ